MDLAVVTIGVGLAGTVAMWLLGILVANGFVWPGETQRDTGHTQQRRETTTTCRAENGLRQPTRAGRSAQAEGIRVQAFGAGAVAVAITRLWIVPHSVE